MKIKIEQIHVRICLDNIATAHTQFQSRLLLEILQIK